MLSVLILIYKVIIPHVRISVKFVHDKETRHKKIGRKALPVDLCQF